MGAYYGQLSICNVNRTKGHQSRSETEEELNTRNNIPYNPTGRIKGVSDSLYETLRHPGRGGEKKANRSQIRNVTGMRFGWRVCFSRLRRKGLMRDIMFFLEKMPVMILTLGEK